MEITPELITQYGLLQKISTGNTFFDLVLCLLVPLLLKHLVPQLAGLPQRLWPAKAAAKTYTRYIEHTQRSGYYWYDYDGAPPNSILQRALLNAVNTRRAALAQLSEADLSLRKRSRAERAADGAADGGGGGGDDSDGDSDDGRGSEHAYDCNLAPPKGTWLDLQNGIRFMLETENLDDKAKATKLTYVLESGEHDGNERIAGFVDEALESYRRAQSARVDPARYLYMPVLSGFGRPAGGGGGEGGDASSSPSAVYKRYKLSEDKSFASFFHPDKDSILRLVDAFLNRTGKFAIPGYPQKLGFLLYGPPGTGKTSFIKALAQHTKRSIISVPLSKISTNQELMDIVFDNKLQILDSSDTAISLPFAKTIFVMEDVDAASNVVQRRTPASPPSGAAAAAAAALAEQVAAAAAAKHVTPSRASRNTSLSRDGGVEDDQDARGGDGGKDADGEKDDGDGRAAFSSSAAAAHCRAGWAAAGGGGSGGGGGGVAVGPSLPLGAWGKGLFRGDDELNLAGLLNVLDGVVDTPNRIIIMTTNHPDKLDPALVRPGRINKKIYMGRLCLPEAATMVAHYFGPLCPADMAALAAAFVDEALSPADLEAMCAEHDTPAELVAALAARRAGGAGREEGYRSCE